MKVNHLVETIGLLVCLCAANPAARAQGKCSLQKLAGTYAFQETGSSSIVSLTTPLNPPVPLHWGAATAPFVTVGEITFTSDGVGKGFYWIRDGSLNGGPNAVLVNGQATMEADCSGTFTYEVDLPVPGSPLTATIVERLILFNGGREYRSLPISIDGGDPTLAWIGVGHRIGEAGQSAYACGPATAHGSYMATADNLVPSPLDATTAFSDTILFPMDISTTGEYTGSLIEKLGPVGGIDLPISGTFNVNPDCSYSWDLNFKIDNVPYTVSVKGVFFDQGRGFFGLAIDPEIAFSAVQGQRVSK